MASIKLYLNFIIVIFNIVCNTNGHPQCLDYRPPFETVETLEFCTEYGSYGCCTKEKDREIMTRFASITNAMQNDNIQGCGTYVKTILCQECSPYAAHIYDAESSDARPFPGLCNGYCRDFYAQCAATIPYISAESLLIANSNNVDMFCSYINLSDVDYCYPHLLTNDVLNGDITREAITQDGCLCLEQFASGLRNALIFEAPKDDSGRLFIGEQVGLVYIYYKNGTSLPTPFMDITDAVLTSSNWGDERGFLGLTFHPDFKNNNKFYTFFSIREDGQHSTRISEFLASVSDPNRADLTSERVLLQVAQPYSNHNGGAMLFGVDGYLYMFLGDGGAGGDPENNSQNKNRLLGKALRIDVDSPPEPGLEYKIPNDNPFINEPDTRSEIYAYGIRNIWRCDVDEGHPITGEGRGRIFCGDVGQNRFEEIDIIESGGNYGWKLREGFQCYRSSPCDTTGPQVLPIHAYSHSVGKSVTGGHVYRGCMNPNLQGKYIYGDFFVGKLFALQESATGWNNTEISMCGSDVCFNGLLSIYETYILSFGEDDDGEIYMLTTSRPSPSSPTGKVYKFVDPRRRGDPASCRSFETPTPTPIPTPTPTDDSNPTSDDECLNATGNRLIVLRRPTLAVHWHGSKFTRNGRRDTAALLKVVRNRKGEKTRRVKVNRRQNAVITISANDTAFAVRKCCISVQFLCNVTLSYKTSNSQWIRQSEFNVKRRDLTVPVCCSLGEHFCSGMDNIHALRWQFQRCEHYTGVYFLKAAWVGACLE